MCISDHNRPDIFPYLLASVLVHVLLVIIFASGLLDNKFSDLKEDVVEVIPLVEDGRQYRIADIAKPALEEKPDKASFLGRYNSAVKKETVAISRGKGKDRQSDGANSSAKKAERSNRAKKSKNASIYNFDYELFARRVPADRVQDGGGAGQVGGSQALEDFYPDYNIGPHTYLNVLRYPDIDYFVRMKRQFKLTFNPIPSLRQHFSGNQVTQGSVNVVLAVSVGGAGELSELFVIQSSGVPTYDKEALRTVRASSPFASPPEKFLEDDGMLRMSWTFTVYL